MTTQIQSVKLNHGVGQQTDVHMVNVKLIDCSQYYTCHRSLEKYLFQMVTVMKKLKFY